MVANLKVPLPVQNGACGLRQSDAVFSHIRNLPLIMEPLREAIRGYSIVAVGCSDRPRDAEGSYMPCFLAGKSAAEAIGAAADVPVYSFSHQNGHLMAALYSSGRSETLLQAPFAAFHVSGGTTELLSVRPGEYGFSVCQIGGTDDLNAGQAIDRVGVRMGLSFPCGREMERLADLYRGSLPAVRVSVKDCVCHLSGLQNLAEKLWTETGDSAYVSAYVIAFIGATLQEMTEQLDERMPGLPVLYAGGVMSNRGLQKLLSVRSDTYFAEPQYSADNAAGIALLCRRRAMNDRNRTN